MIAAELATLPWGHRQSPSGDSALTRTDVQALMQVSDTGLYRAKVIQREGPGNARKVSDPRHSATQTSASLIRPRRPGSQRIMRHVVHTNIRGEIMSVAPTAVPAPAPIEPPNPRAEAKAAKAYRKAMRPWYQKKRFWLLGVIVLIVVISIIAGTGGGTKATSTAQPSNQVQVAPNAAPAAPAAAAASDGAADPTTLSDNGWKVATFTTAADGLGNFGADARITNGTGSDKEAGSFTMTVLDPSKNIIATLVGSATKVAKGETATVQFVSTTPFKAEPLLYAFQVDASF